MEFLSVSSSREGVIIVVDANRKKINVDAVEWAFRHVVRRKDVVLVLGVLCDLGKHKSYSCFPLMNNMGGSISGIWEKLDLSSGHGEVNPKQLGEEIERKREQYQTSLQPFCRYCKKNEVKMEVKLAAGYCPARLTVDEAQNSNIRWIVLDSHLKQHKLYIYGRVGCNVAIMKGKDFATWMPTKSPQRRTSPRNCNGAFRNNNQPQQEEPSSNKPAEPNPRSPYWYPLSWRTGFPRAFGLDEIEEITCSFAEENKLKDTDNIIIYKGLFQESAPVLVQSFLENDDRFWSMLMILSRIRHRSIINLVGYCCTGTSRFILSDYPYLGTVETNLIDDSFARKLTWKARWYIAIEVGGSLRYLHEECSGGSIVHQSICSAHIIYTHGGSAMLSNFVTAKWIHEESPADHDQCSNSEKEESPSVDVHDYGVLLLELLSGKSARCFPEHGEGQSLVAWALPHLEAGSIGQIIDPRLMKAENETCRLVGYMVKAALLCLKDGASDFVRPSISEVLAVVRGDQLANCRC